MSTEPLEQAITSTREVLTAVTTDQLTLDTPCQKWSVAELIDHIVGGLQFFASGAAGEAPAGGDTKVSDGDYLAAYDQAATRAVSAFNADGVMDKTLDLPFGPTPAPAFLGMAVTDTFTHGWDLAKATGQGTDLAPELSGSLLERAKSSFPDSFRTEDGSVFGFEQQAPAGATNADQLAAFLGRTV